MTPECMRMARLDTQVRSGTQPKFVDPGTVAGFASKLTSLQKRLLLTGLVALASMACSAADAPGTLGQHTSNLDRGTLDPDTEAVFALQIAVPNPRLCSAVLVAPNVFLTARHCLAVDAEVEVVCGETPLDRLVEADAISLGNALAPLDAPLSSSPAVARIDVPPDGEDVCGYDIALVLLAENLDTQPLPVRLERGPEVGERYTAVGYGQSAARDGSRAGLRMRLEDRLVRCVGTPCSPPAGATEFGGGDGVCLGDSGGPAIDPEGRVFGIASRSAEGCKTPIYTSLAAFDAWLDPLLDEAAELGDYERASRDLTVEPEPEPEPEPELEPIPSSEPPPRRLGETCSDQRACEPALACVYETTPTEARCRPRCHEDADCPDAQVCDAEALVCWTPARDAEAGCRLGQTPRSAGVPSLMLLMAVVCIGRRRSRRP